MLDSENHWLSVLISLFAVIFSSVMVADIMPCDVSEYDELEAQEEDEKTGWKLVRGDVFRHPTNSVLLCVYAGTSVRCFGTILVTMVFAALGFLSPSNQGELMTALLSL